MRLATMSRHVFMFSVRRYSSVGSIPASLTKTAPVLWCALPLLPVPGGVFQSWQPTQDRFLRGSVISHSHYMFDALEAPLFRFQTYGIHSVRTPYILHVLLNSLHRFQRGLLFVTQYKIPPVDPLLKLLDFSLLPGSRGNVEKKPVFYTGLDYQGLLSFGHLTVH